MIFDSRQAALWAALTSLFLGFAFAIPGTAEEVSRVEIENEGWILVGDVHLPDRATEPVPVVLLFNKAAGDREAYEALAGKLTARGIGALRLDLRGHGESVNIDVFDFEVRKNNHILEGTYRDIAAAHEYVRADLRFEGQPVAMLGASYSGEHAVMAADVAGFAEAYVMLSPGSFSVESTEKIDSSGVPWLFIRAEVELPFFDEIFADISRLSRTAETRVLPGRGHGSDIFIGRPELEDEVADWLRDALVK